MDKKVTLAQLQEIVQEAYEQVKTNTGGKNADYIPYLANVNKDLFGISVCQSTYGDSGITPVRCKRNTREDRS